MKRTFTVLALSAVLAGVVCVMPAAAVEPGEVLPDQALEARARGLSAKLRCLVCQNQSIDDSNAPLAKDLRLLVRERLSAGESDDAVIGYIVARYGDFVLLQPPFKPSTILLWLAPLLGLAGIGYALLRASGRIGAPPVAAAISQTDEDRLTRAEEERLDALLGQPPPLDRR